jgi:hypothetical protein
LAFAGSFVKITSEPMSGVRAVEDPGTDAVTVIVPDFPWASIRLVGPLIPKAEPTRDVDTAKSPPPLLVIVNVMVAGGVDPQLTAPKSTTVVARPSWGRPIGPESPASGVETLPPSTPPPS